MECAADHIQLAEWPKELKEHRAADIQPVEQWISVENRFPNDGERVIVYTVDKKVLEMKFDKRRESWGRIDGMEWFGKSFVTRWQPLPEPPKEG